MSLRIKLSIEGQKSRWAQNRSKTFDASITVVKPEDAKVFQTHEECYRWLRRNGFPVKTHGICTFPEPFTGWAIVKDYEIWPPQLPEPAQKRLL